MEQLIYYNIFEVRFKNIIYIVYLLYICKLYLILFSKYNRNMFLKIFHLFLFFFIQFEVNSFIRNDGRFSNFRSGAVGINGACHIKTLIRRERLCQTPLARAFIYLSLLSINRTLVRMEWHKINGTLACELENAIKRQKLNGTVVRNDRKTKLQDCLYDKI